VSVEHDVFIRDVQDLAQMIAMRSVHLDVQCCNHANHVTNGMIALCAR
jgi:hypothetical protein